MYIGLILILRRLTLPLQITRPGAIENVSLWESLRTWKRELNFRPKKWNNEVQKFILRFHSNITVFVTCERDTDCFKWNNLSQIMIFIYTRKLKPRLKPFNNKKIDFFCVGPLIVMPCCVWPRNYYTPLYFEICFSFHFRSIEKIKLWVEWLHIFQCSDRKEAQC